MTSDQQAARVERLKTAIEEVHLLGAPVRTEPDRERRFAWSTVDHGDATKTIEFTDKATGKVYGFRGDEILVLEGLLYRAMKRSPVAKVREVPPQAAVS